MWGRLRQIKSILHDMYVYMIVYCIPVCIYIFIITIIIIIYVMHSFN